MSSPQPLVLFDIDGTILHGAGPHHRLALLAGVRKEFGVETSFEGMDTAGTLDRDLLGLLIQSAGIPAEAGRQALPRIIDTCEQAYLSNCATDLRPYICPGVAGFLATLREANVAIGVVTGNLHAIGWQKLHLAGLRHYFDVGAFSQDGVTRAELAQVARQRAGTPDNGVVVHIGDHRNDILAAKANGFRSVAVASGVLSLPELLRHQPDLAVNDMTGLTLENTVYAKNVSIRDTSSALNRNSIAPIVPST